MSHTTAGPCPAACTGSPHACMEAQPHSTACRAPTTSLTCVPAAPFLQPDSLKYTLGILLICPPGPVSATLHKLFPLRGLHLSGCSWLMSFRPLFRLLPLRSLPWPSYPVPLTQLHLHGFDRSPLECQLREGRHLVLLTLVPGIVPDTPKVLDKCLWPSWVKQRLGEGGGSLSSGLANCLTNRPLVCKIERLLTNQLLGSWEV